MSRPNKYRGTCRECSRSVGARQGTLERIGGKWAVLCSGCGGNGVSEPVAPNYFANYRFDTAKERILDWCQSSNAPKNTGMRQGSLDLTDKPYTVRDVAAWGSDRNDDGTDNERIVYARAATWDEVEYLLEQRFPYEPAQSGSSYTRFSGGAEVYTNRNGRCEDAPCCGCCS